MNREEALKALERVYQESEDHYEMKSDKKFYVVNELHMDALGHAIDYLRSEASGPMVKVEEVFDTFNKYVSSLPDPSLLDLGQFLTVLKNELPRYPGVDADAAAREIMSRWMGVGSRSRWVECPSENEPQRAAMTGMSVAPRLYSRDKARKAIAAIITRHVKGADNAENH